MKNEELKEYVYIGRYDSVDYRTRLPIKRMQLVRFTEQDIGRYQKASGMFIKKDEFDAYVSRAHDRRNIESFLVGRWERKWKNVDITPFNLTTNACNLELLKYFTKFENENDLLDDACEQVGLEYINEGPECKKDQLIELCETIGFDYNKDKLPRGELIVILQHLFGKDHPRFSTKKEEKE